MKRWIVGFSVVALSATAGIGYMTAASSSKTGEPEQTGDETAEVDFERYRPESEGAEAPSDEKTGDESDDSSSPSKEPETAEATQKAPESERNSGETDETAETEIRVLGVEQTDKSEESTRTDDQKPSSSEAAARRAMAKDLEGIRIKNINPVTRGIENIPARVNPKKLPTPKSDDSDGSKGN